MVASPVGPRAAAPVGKVKRKKAGIAGNDGTSGRNTGQGLPQLRKDPADLSSACTHTSEYLFAGVCLCKLSGLLEDRGGATS